ncbi:MAG: prepilin-type N-terminal cleavage/methylation domain-containing protein [Candidatus Aminicenantes bacterium]|nr:prepilin-type N-terminal cleavage/methylation domain-containing protein [Candidatus Aminicenantes bacterium]
MDKRPSEKNQLRGKFFALPAHENFSPKGFTLIEVIISLALVTVVFVSLAQLFTLSVMQNLRSNEISNAIFLAQQQIDYLRTLTSDELSTFPNTSIGENNDELIDINQDGTIDFRRLTVVRPSVTANAGFDVLVLVFPASVQNKTVDDLITAPDKNKIRAYIHTIITR